jgi:hypothetical protein
MLRYTYIAYFVIVESGFMSAVGAVETARVDNGLKTEQLGSVGAT